jgi:hypothetical protein
LAPTAPAAAALTAPAASATALAPVVIRPVAPERYRIAFTADGDTRELLELARDLLRHAVPSGDPAEIFARSLKALVEDLVRRKFAAASRPRRSRSAGHDARHIPAEVKRAVYLRDRGLCAYASPLGHRCGERAFLEFHHLTPVAAGGTATVDNIQLRCRVHNALEAELYFGATRVSEAGPAYTVSAMTRFRSGTKTDLGQRNEAWIGGTDDDVVLGRAKLREQVHHRECRSSRQGSPRMW